MRVLSALDWPTFVEGVSRVERILRRDPAEAYADMDRPTRDRYRKSVEQLSRRSGTDELEVAERAIAARRRAQRERPDADRAHHVGYYLISRGRFELEREVRLLADQPASGSPAGFQASGDRIPRHPRAHDACSKPACCCTRETTALAVDDRVCRARRPCCRCQRARLQLSQHDSDHHHSAAPAAEARAYATASPIDLRTIVAVPTILSSPARVRELVDALEVRALGESRREPAVRAAGRSSRRPR